MKIILCLLMIYISVPAGAQDANLVLPFSHTSDINYIEFSKDSRFVLTASKDKTVNVWQAEGGRSITRINGDLKYELSSRFTAANDVLYVSLGNTAGMWSAKTGKIVQWQLEEDIEMHGLLPPQINPVAGELITLSNKTKKLSVWDYNNGKLKKSLKVSDTLLFIPELSKSGKYFLINSINKELQLWDAVNWRQVYSIKPFNDICFGRFSPNDNYLIANSVNDLKVYSRKNKELVVSLSGIKFSLITPDEKYLIYTSGNSIYKQDLQNKSSLSHEEIMPANYPLKFISVAITPDSKFCVFSDELKNSFIYDIANNKFLNNSFTKQAPEILFPAGNITFSPNGKLMAVSYGKMAAIYETATWKLTNSLTGFLSFYQDVWFSEKSKLKFRKNNGDFFTWDLLNCNSDGFYQSPDIRDELGDPENRFRIFLTKDNSLVIIDKNTGKLLTEILLFGKVRSISFSPPGNLLMFELDAIARLRVMCFLDINKVVEQYSYLDIQHGVIRAIDKNEQTRLFQFFMDGDIMDDRLQHQQVFYESPNFFTTYNVADKTAVPSYLFSNTGAYLISTKALDGGIIDIFKTPEMREAAGQINIKGDHLHCVSISNDGSLVAINTQYKNTSILDIHGKLLTSCKYPFDAGLLENTFNLKFTNDNHFLIGWSAILNVGREVNPITVWDTKTGKIVTRITFSDINYESIHPSKNKFLFVQMDGKACELDMETGVAKIIFTEAQKKFNSINYSPDGKFIFTVVKDGITEFRDAGDLKLIASIEGSDLVFSGDNKLLVSNYRNYLNIYDLKNLKLLYRLSVMGNDDYITMAPDGYYFCSKGILSKLNYSKGASIISLQQLDVRYNRPDKILEIAGRFFGNPDTALTTSYRRAYQKRISKLRVDTTSFQKGFSVPETNLVNKEDIIYDRTDDQLLLHIKAVDTLYNLALFNIRINNVPLFGKNGLSIGGKNKHSFDTSVTVILSQGENKIETSVYNVNGSESYRVPLFVKYTPLKAKQEKVYFVGIGINHFADSAYNLQYCEKDIRDIALQLKEKYGTRLQVDTLFNENVTVEKIRAIKQNLQKSKEDDKVIIAYSGHGLLSSDYDYYLSTYSINFKRPEQNGLPYDELEHLLDSIKARKKLMLVDACHSGELDKDEMRNTDWLKTNLKKNNVVSSEIKGLIIKVPPGKKLGMKNSFELMQELFVNMGNSTGSTIISAASGTQYAMEKGDLKNGVFTYCLLEAMKKNKTMTVNKLKQYVNTRVPELTNGLQQPTSRSENIDLDWDAW